MSHVVFANQYSPPPSGLNDTFHGIWRLTRVLLAAGWKYRASGDATTGGTKDTSGVANTFESAFASDKWGVSGGVNLLSNVQTGTTLSSITANTDGTATITFSGTTFTASSVGRFLTTSGDLANPANNGNFRITTFTSATSIKIFNPGAVTEASPAVTSWQEQEGGASGTIATAGTGGALPGRAIFSISGASTPWVSPTTGPTITRGSTGDRLTIIGAAVAANNGTFRITRVISNQSVEIDNPNATSSGETNNGTLHWVQCSPIAQIYPASISGTTGSGAWWCARGPSMMKIPIGANVTTGTFQKGELVTQTTSGATGIIIGVMTDTTGSTGFLTIEPRLNGSGGGPRGWTSGTTDTVSAQSSPTGSGATVTSSTSAPVEYVIEAVWWKAGNGTQGHHWMQSVDQSGESASLYSQIATAAGTTNTVAPGGAAASFPTPGSWVVYGTANSGAATTGSVALFFTNTQTFGANHIIAANCIETSTVSQDGSFLTVLGGESTGTPPGYVGNGFQRCDDSEDGDVVPYVSLGFPGSENYNGTRTTQTTTTSGTDFFNTSTYFGASTITSYRSFRRRGFASGDAWQEFNAACQAGFNSVLLTNANNFPVATIANSVISTTSRTLNRDPIWMVSTQSAQKMRKGTLRWFFGVEGGVAGDLHASGTFVQLRTPEFSATFNDAVVVGPWDGFSEIKNA